MSPVITNQTPVRLPASIWLAAMGAAAVAGGAWYSLKAEVGQHTQDIADLKGDAKIQHELLIRVDENVKLLRRDAHP